MQTQTRVVAITGYKGGVGKTTISLCLAMHMSQVGQRILLVDGDVTAPSMSDYLGQSSQKSTIATSAIERTSLLSQINDSIYLYSPHIPFNHTGPSFADTAIHIQGAQASLPIVDTTFIDIPSGASEVNHALTQSANHIVTLITSENASIDSAANQIAFLHQHYAIHQFYIIVNLVNNRHTGDILFLRLQQQLSHTKNISLVFLGTIPFDKQINNASKKKSTIHLNNDSRFYKAIQKINAQIQLLPSVQLTGRIDFFYPSPNHQGAIL